MAITAKLLTRTLVFAFAASVAVVLQTSSPAHACSCVGLERVLADGTNFDAAFVGTVVEAPKPFTSGNSAQLVEWKFRVEQVYRGELPATVAVKSAASGASCGFENFAVGSQVGVLLRREGNVWQSGLCSSGTPQQLAVLGNPKPPSGETPSPTVGRTGGGTTNGGDDDGGGNDVAVALAVGGALVLVAGAATAAFTRRRRQVTA
jgi:hypothetical protein